jgi:hypothetical protein
MGMSQATLAHAPVSDRPGLRCADPYFGTDDIGLLQWAPVIGTVAIGLWCGWEAFVDHRPARTTTSPA